MVQRGVVFDGQCTINTVFEQDENDLCSLGGNVKSGIASNVSFYNSTLQPLEAQDTPFS